MRASLLWWCSRLWCLSPAVVVFSQSVFFPKIVLMLCVFILFQTAFVCQMFYQMIFFSRCLSCIGFLFSVRFVLIFSSHCLVFVFSPFVTVFVCLQVFSQMVFVGVTFSFSCLVQVLAACVQEIELNLSKIASPGEKDDPIQLKVRTVCSPLSCSRHFCFIVTLSPSLIAFLAPFRPSAYPCVL